MSALGNIANCYNSDSEDQSDSEQNNTVKRSALSANIQRLPVPEIIAKKRRVEEHIDKAEDHSGRVRSFPHERGNWSTYIYIHCPPTTSITYLINKLIENCKSVCTINTIEDFHITLSRTFVLKFHWIQNFVLSLKKSICNIDKFIVHFDSLEIYCNDEKTRTFIGLKVDSGSSEILKDIISKIDPLLEELNLKTFYEDASFHVSLLWCLGNRQGDLKKLMPNFLQILNEKKTFHTQEDSTCDLMVNNIICKSGNKTFSFNLV